MLMRSAALCALLVPAMVSAESRFSGQVGLEARAGDPANHRFELRAALQPDTARHEPGRLEVKAALVPEVAVAATSCGPVVNDIFRNGFE